LYRYQLDMRERWILHCLIAIILQIAKFQEIVRHQFALVKPIAKSSGTQPLAIIITSTRMPFSGVNPPKEPASYDPQNRYKDPVAYFKHREAIVAEEFVKVAEAKVS